MGPIRRFFASAVAVISAVAIVAFGAVLFLFGGVFMTILMVAVGIIGIVGTLAYGIYEAITDSDEDRHI